MGRCHPSPTTSVGDVRHHVFRADASISASAASSVSSAGSAQVHLESHRSATTFVRVPSVDDADVHGNTRPATVEPLERDDSVRGLEHRVASLLGLDAGVRSPTGDRDPESVIPFLAETMSPFARAPSSTNAASCWGASSRITGTEYGEPISSSGLHTYVMVPNPSKPGVLQHLARDQSRQQAALHVRYARATRDVALHAERPFGDGAPSKTVSM